MASMSKAQRKRELREELAAARLKFAGNWVALKEDVNVPKRVRESMRERKLLWIVSATLIGFIVSRLPARKKEVLVDAKSRKKIEKRKKAGLIMGLMKFALGVLKPTITAYATKKLADIASIAVEARGIETAAARESETEIRGANAEARKLPA
jgi:hypothetical protein